MTPIESTTSLPPDTGGKQQASQDSSVLEPAPPRASGAWRRSAIGAGVVLVAAVIFGLTGSNQWIEIANTALITSIAALALNLLLGHTGLVSIGNAAFLAIGAVSAAQVASIHRGPFWLALIAGGVASGFIGLLLAIPASRIKGLYLAMGTLAFHFITVATLNELQDRQVGPAGYQMPKASIFGNEIGTIRTWYVVLVIALGITVVFLRSLLTRKPGRAWRAIREQQSMAAMSGISVFRYKVWAFVISSTVVGFAGALSAYYLGVITSESFVLHLAVLYLAYVIIGGMGSMYGPIVGAFFLVSLPHLIESSRSGLGVGTNDQRIFFYQDAAIGAAVVIMILIEPLGLARLVSRAVKALERVFRSVTRREASGEGQP